MTYLSKRLVIRELAAWLQPEIHRVILLISPIIFINIGMNKAWGMMLCL
ncbi:hypothetical protein B194_5125 [Serratia plymuthica A30]|nr:hypothetical protein B194_5125 [Serratia plymuthica A30]